MSTRAQPVFDMATPVYATSGFLMGLSGLSLVSFLSVQLGFKIFSHTLQGARETEGSLNLLGDVSSSFLMYLYGSNMRGKVMLTEPEEPPLPPMKPKEPLPEAV